MEQAVTLVVFPPAALDRLADRQLGEALDYLDPDVVVVERLFHAARVRTAQPDAPILSLSNPTEVFVTEGPGPQVVHLPNPGDFDVVRAYEQDGTLDTETETFVLAAALAVDIDLTKLETRLDGREPYEDALRRASLTGSYTHLTSNAAPAYRNDWNGLVVQGVFPGASDTDETPAGDIAALQLYADGTVAADTYDPGRFGLAGLDSVGPTRARTLRDAGVRTKAAVAERSVDDLRRLDGFGPASAKTVRYSAKARVDGTVYRTSTDSLPGNDPVFIDIETDGLSPTMIWLIGVYDSRTGQYRSFMTTDPAEKGAAVTAFMEWYTETATGRPLIAYNGDGFDFPHLHDHISQHCPEYLDAWREAWTFDLFWWASKQGNAVLPGLTNRLDDVASAVGWDGADTGLSGAVVGQRFQRWLANPCDATELDWERHRAYCEDDVRALAHVYDAVRDADPVPGVTRSDGPRETEQTTTTQGTLTDF